MRPITAKAREHDELTPVIDAEEIWRHLVLCAGNVTAASKALKCTRQNLEKAINEYDLRFQLDDRFPRADRPRAKAKRLK